MPSVSKKQKHLMDAVAHGWKMPGGKGPSEKVAKDFVRADKAKGSRPERAKARKGKLDKWARARSDAKSNVSEYKT